MGGRIRVLPQLLLSLLAVRSAAKDPDPADYSKVSCWEAIDGLLSPAQHSALAIANDATSSFNLDAFAELAPTTGYPGQIGDYGECSKVSLLTNFSTHLCLAGSLDLATMQGQPPMGAVCVPRSCGPDDMQWANFTSAWLADKEEKMALHANSSTVSAISYVSKLQQMMEVVVQRGKGFTCGSYKRLKVGVDAWCFILFLSLLALFVVWATVMDLIKGPDYPEFIAKKQLNSDRLGPNGGGYDSILDAAQREAGDGTPPLILLEDQVDHVPQLLAAFSVPRNLRRLFRVGARSELRVFDGMRVISMLWVVLGHILAVQASIGYTDPEAVFPPNGLVAQYVGQLFFSARFAVDTFFYVSGFLVVYVLMRRFDGGEAGGGGGGVGGGGGGGGGLGGGRLSGQGPLGQGQGLLSAEGGGGEAGKLSRSTGYRRMTRWAEWLPLFYIHRIFRITPPYVITLLFWWKLAVFLGEGPMWYRWEWFIGLCDKFWWSNVLYINNFVPWHSGELMECFYHTWYLANDMQFYVLSPMFIVLYLKSRALGAGVVMGLVVLSTSAMVWGTYHRHWSSLTLDGAWTIRYSQETYTMPWFRIVPYLVGMLFGMLWHEKRKYAPDLLLSQAWRYGLLLTGCALLVVVTFAGHSGYSTPPCLPSQNPVDDHCGSMWPLWKLACYNAGARPAWSLGLSLICFVCFNNQGGLVQQLLEHKSWVPLARMTFTAYLIHPILINLWFMNSTVKFHFSKLDFVMVYIAIATATFGAALVLSLLVESPLTVVFKMAEGGMKRLLLAGRVLDEEETGVSSDGTDRETVEANELSFLKPNGASPDERRRHIRRYGSESING